jgi:hypothetical protein
MIKHQLSQTLLPFQRRCPVRPKAADSSPIPSSSSPSCKPRRHAQERRGERRRPTSTPESPRDIIPRRDLRDGAVFAPLFFTGGPALRARISGGEYQDVRARPVVGLSLARVPAICPVTLHFRARARPLQPTATVPTTTSASTTRSTSRPVMHATVPSPHHHSAADSIAVSVHAACKQLLVSWASGWRPVPCTRLRLCPERPRHEAVGPTISGSGRLITDDGSNNRMPCAGGRTDTLQACCSDPQQWERTRRERVAGCEATCRATCLAQSLDRCTWRLLHWLARHVQLSLKLFSPCVAGGPAPVDIRIVREILTYRSSARLASA